MTDEQRVEKLAEQLAAEGAREHQNIEDRLRALELQSVDRVSYERKTEAIETLVRELQTTIIQLSIDVKGDLREWRGRLWALSLAGPIIIAILSEVLRRFAMAGKP